VQLTYLFDPFSERFNVAQRYQHLSPLLGLLVPEASQTSTSGAQILAAQLVSLT
jgi:hypothetical protein